MTLCLNLVSDPDRRRPGVPVGSAGQAPRPAA